MTAKTAGLSRCTMSRRLTCPHDEHCCAACRETRRRAQNTGCAARQRAKQFAARQGTAARCVRRFGRSGVCNAQLVVEIDRLGRTTTRCLACERFRAGVCRVCPSPVHGVRGKARHCAIHQRAVRRASTARYVAEHREEVRAKTRARDQEPERRARKIEYKRAWRQANVDQVKKEKRREALKQPQRVYDYMARYRKRHREYYRVMARERYRAANPRRTPACSKCGEAVIWDYRGRPSITCDRCCWPHQLRDRLERRARTAAAQPLVAKKPARVVKPKTPARLLPSGERLCCSSGCTSVVSGRRKKCDTCWSRDASIAARLLEERRSKYARRSA